MILIARKAQETIRILIDDRELRAKLIANGHQTANQWSWDRSLNFLEKFLNGDNLKNSSPILKLRFRKKARIKQIPKASL